MERWRRKVMYPVRGEGTVTSEIIASLHDYTASRQANAINKKEMGLICNSRNFT